MWAYALGGALAASRVCVMRGRGGVVGAGVGFQGPAFFGACPLQMSPPRSPILIPPVAFFSEKMLQEYRTSLVVLGCRGTSGELHTAPLAVRRAGWGGGEGAALKGACQIL